MRKPIALFSAYVLLLAQCQSLLAQQVPATPTPTASKGPSLSLGGIRGWLQRYQMQDIEPIDLRNSSRLESLLRAGRLYLSLQDAIALALENNLDIEIQRYGPKLAQAELLRAQAGGALRGIPTTISNVTTQATSQVTGGNQLGTASNTGGTGANAASQAGGFVFTQSGTTIPNLDPILSTGYGYNHRSAIQANSFASGVAANITSVHSPFISVQKGFLTGTSASLDFNNTHLLSNIPRAEINPFFTSNLGFSINQNLLRGFGTAVNNRQIRIARNEITAADLVFRQQVISTVSAVINLYWDLVSYGEDAKVKKQALSLAEKLLGDNRKQVEIGTLAPIEIVRAEAEVARNQQDLTISETRLLQQETIIKNALSRVGVSSPSVAEARVVPTDSIRIPEQEEIQPIQDLVSSAMSKRPDIEQTRVSVESSKIGLEGSKSALKPQLDLQASMRNNGLAGSVNSIGGAGLPAGFLPQANPYFLGGYGTALSQLFRRNFPDYSIGFQLTVPISNRQARADMANDLLRLRQAELRQQAQTNQIRVEVQNALIGLQQARASYQSSLKSRVLAEQTLDAEQKKYGLGASTIFLVIQAQRDLAIAQANEVAALSSYSRARNALDQSTGRTLDVNNISFEEAMKGQVSRPPTPPPVLDNAK